jgi:hypothetical protein
LAAGLVLAALLALAALQVPQLGAAIRAAHGEGTRGEFTLQQYGCGRFSCTWTGVFVADKGDRSGTGQPSTGAGGTPRDDASSLHQRLQPGECRLRNQGGDHQPVRLA